MAVNWLSQGNMVCADTMFSDSGANLCRSVNVSNVSLCLLEIDRQEEPQQRGQWVADEVGDFPGRSDVMELVDLRKGEIFPGAQDAGALVLEELQVINSDVNEGCAQVDMGKMSLRV